MNLKQFKISMVFTIFKWWIKNYFVFSFSGLVLCFLLDLTERFDLRRSKRKTINLRISIKGYFYVRKIFMINEINAEDEKKNVKSSLLFLCNLNSVQYGYRDVSAGFWSVHFSCMLHFKRLFYQLT